jgi:hypothetical protein
VTDAPAQPEDAMPDADVLAELVARFRLWSFHVYYARSFASVQDLTERFVKALVASTAPIKDMAGVLEWHRSGEYKRYRGDPQVEAQGDDGADDGAEQETEEGAEDDDVLANPRMD